MISSSGKQKSVLCTQFSLVCYCLLRELLFTEFGLKYATPVNDVIGLFCVSLQSKPPPPPPTGFPKAPQAAAPPGPGGPPGASVNVFSRRAGNSQH